MSLALVPAASTAVTQFRSTTAISRAHGSIIKVIEDKKHSLEEQSKSIKGILEQTFKDAPSGQDVKIRDDCIATLATIDEKINNKIQSIILKHKDLKEKYNTLCNENENLKQRQAEIRQTKQPDYDKLKEKYQKLEADYKKVETENSLLQDKADIQVKDYAKLVADYKSLNNESEKIKTRSGQIAHTYKQLDAKHQDSSSKIQRIQSSFDELKTEYAKLQELLEKIEKLNAELEDELAKKTKITENYGTDQTAFYYLILKSIIGAFSPCLAMGLDGYYSLYKKYVQGNQ